MQQLLVDGLGSGLYKRILFQGVCGEYVSVEVSGVLLKQVELHFVAFAVDGAREEYIFEFVPVLPAPTLLLLHQINTPNHAPVIINMSNISTKKIRSFWKVSDSSKVYNIENSVNEGSRLLPQKFSPHKSIGREDSRIFNTSKDRKMQRSPSIASKDSQFLNLSLSKHSVTRKESLSGILDSPIKQTHQITSKESILLKEEILLDRPQSESPLPPPKPLFELNYELLKSQQLVNLQAIYQIKTDFNNFKTEVWNELMSQRDLIATKTAQIMKKIEQCTRKEIQVQQVVHPLNSITTFDILDKITLKMSGFEQQQKHKVQSLPPPIARQEPQQSNSSLAQQSNEINPTIHIDKLQVGKPGQALVQQQKKHSPIDRCNHIVETIGILNQINSSPVSNKAKSIEKLYIQQYKQKLISVCKSNQRLIRQPLRQQQVRKGNPKLQKFYNAIEKLKEQVNQIRNIKSQGRLNILKVNN